MSRKTFPVIAVRAGDLRVGDRIAVEHTHTLCPNDLFDLTRFVSIVDVTPVPHLGDGKIGISVPVRPRATEADMDEEEDDIRLGVAEDSFKKRLRVRTRVLHEDCVVCIVEKE